MTRAEAHEKARRLWRGENTDAPGWINEEWTCTNPFMDRIFGRREFQVGYWPKRLRDGARASIIVMGRGPSWEAAFADAAAREKGATRGKSRPRVPPTDKTLGGQGAL